MKQKHAMVIHVLAIIGMLLALLVRNEFDGVALLFFIIAMMAFALRLYLRNVEYLEREQDIADSIDANRKDEEVVYDQELDPATDFGKWTEENKHDNAN